MLIYHFGTLDGLLHEVLRQARQRQVEAFTDLGGLDVEASRVCLGNMPHRSLPIPADLR
jgi:AcrR family transcriptional regulator